MKYIFLALCLFFTGMLRGQDSLAISVSRDYISQLQGRISTLEAKLDKSSAKALADFEKVENKILGKLSRIDSSRAMEIKTTAESRYSRLKKKMEKPGRLTEYVPFLDTLKTSLKFLEQNKQVLTRLEGVDGQLREALEKVDALEDQLAKAEQVKSFIAERKRYLQRQLEGLGFARQLKKLNKKAYYYAAQINEYKSLLKDQKKLEQKALELLSKTSFFQDFMRRNGELAGLFSLPQTPGNTAVQASLGGLQPRAQVMQQFQQRAGTSANADQLRSNLQQAQGQLQQLKSRIPSFAGSADELDMPDFKPNTQKTKSLLKRLEFGANVQALKGRGYFPATADIGVSLGYKLNDKSIIGIGGSYKMGLGSFNRIRITHQGIGLRSFADWRLKGKFFLSGGYEVNYFSEFRSLTQLPQASAWQRSGLIGLNKKYQVNKKLKGSMQLLWDFLSTSQVPKTQPILFRIGYAIN